MQTIKIKKNKDEYNRKLPMIVAALKKRYKPQKIVLFGSMLNPHKESHDIDLFLIKETKVKRLGERMSEAAECVAHDEIPVDYLIYTPKEVDFQLERGNVFIEQIMKKGKVLYG